MFFLIDSNPLIYGSHLGIDLYDSTFKNINQKSSIPVFCNTHYSKVNIFNSKFENMK